MYGFEKEDRYCIISVYPHISIYVVVGIKASAASIHTAEDSGTDAGLPGCYDHNDLHATQGKHPHVCHLGRVPFLQ